MPGPPNKFQSFVDLTGISSGADTVAALNTAWAAFYAAYGVYPNTWPVIGSVVYLGYYGS
jgi:hypothetical protein